MKKESEKTDVLNHLSMGINKVKKKSNKIEQQIRKKKKLRTEKMEALVIKQSTMRNSGSGRI